MKNNKLAVFIVLIIIVLLAGFWAYNSSQKNRNEAQPSQNAPASMGATIYDKVKVENPAGNMPNTNPFSAPTNPFKDSYKNPF